MNERHTFWRKMGMSFLPPLLFLDAFLLALAAEYEFMVGLWLIAKLGKMS